MNNTEIQPQILTELINASAWEELRRQIARLDPADLADFLEEQSSEVRDKIFALLDTEAASDVIVEMEDGYLDDLVEEFSHDRIAELAGEMAVDDAVDFLQDLEPEQAEAALSAMDIEKSSEIRRILESDEDSASHIMTPEICAMRASDTVAAAKQFLAKTEMADPILYVYLTDDKQRLCGLVPFPRLFQAESTIRLQDLADTDFVFAREDEDREDIAVKFRKYDLWVMPVIDYEGRLVGRITVDDIMDVVQEEADNDLAHLVGAPDIETEGASAFQSARLRFPWLLVTMFAGMLISIILKHLLVLVRFEVVALFVPMVLAMGGNTGMQSSAIAVRGLALGEKKYRRLFSLVRREIMVGVFLGVICGFICSLIVCASLTFFGNPSSGVSALRMGVIVGISMCNAMAFAASYGALVPVILHRLQVDPAVASGPFVTTSNDLSAALIYFGTCLLLLRAVI